MKLYLKEPSGHISLLIKDLPKEDCDRIIHEWSKIGKQVAYTKQELNNDK